MKINDVVRRKLDWTWKFLGHRIPAEVQATHKLIDGNVVSEHEKCCNAAVGNGAMAVKNNPAFDLPLVPRTELH